MALSQCPVAAGTTATVWSGVTIATGNLTTLQTKTTTAENNVTTPSDNSRFGLKSPLIGNYKSLRFLFSLHQPPRTYDMIFSVSHFA